MVRLSLFVEQLMLVVSGVVLIIMGLWLGLNNQTVWYQGSSIVHLISGVFLIVVAPFILYILHKKLYDSDHRVSE